MARKEKNKSAEKTLATKSVAKNVSGNGAGRNPISNLEREALALPAGPPPGTLSIAPLK